MELNWNEAEHYLQTCEAAYTAIGKAGLFALIYVISPLRERFNSGERTEELYEAIMNISL